MDSETPRHRVHENPPRLAVVDTDDAPTPEVVSTPSDEFKQRLDAYVDHPSHCTALGGQCGQPVVAPGATVCRVHGGAAPQVREAALSRIREARDGALDALITTLDTDADKLDPRTLLDVVTKLTDKLELLEGRATARTETTEFKLEEARKTFKVKLDALADSYKRAPSVLDMVDRMMGEGKYAPDAEDDDDKEAADG